MNEGLRSTDRALRIEPLDRFQIEILRRMSPEERIRRGLEWSDFVLGCVRTRIRHRHPDWADTDVGLDLVRQLHGVEL